MWFKVPMCCKSREDKDILISNITNKLEQTIKIQKDE